MLLVNPPQRPSIKPPSQGELSTDSTESGFGDSELGPMTRGG